MAEKVLMPKTGADATEAKLVRWFKQNGESVNKGDIVAEIETEKVNMEVEAFYAGTLHILVPEGTTMEVGKPIALLLKEGEQPPVESAPAASAPAANGARTPQAAQATPPAAAAGTPAKPADRPAPHTPAPAPTAPVSGLAASGAQGATPAPAAAQAGPATLANGRLQGDRIKASPLARRMAQEHNLDLAAIPGRGPGGRVVREDVEAAIAAARAAPAPAPAVAAPAPVEVEAPALQPVAAGVNERQLTRIQLTAARRLAESKQQAPHFYLTIEVDMAEAMRLRKTLNEQAEGQVKISVNDLVVKACAHALTRHPNLNCSYRDGKVLLYDRINISVAIDTEEGLVSPVIPDVDKKSLGQIARESRALVERARGKRLRPEDYAGGTFTVSNLGMFDIDTFVAIINPPQAAILAVGAVRQIPVVRDGQLTIGEIMKVTLSADHRATDGAAGARFLADLRRALEKPLLMAL